MKTLILFNEFLDSDDKIPGPTFYELEGDYRHLNNVYINSIDNQEKHDELNDLMYHPIGHPRHGYIKHPSLNQPTKDWDFFIHCGFLP